MTDSTDLERVTKTIALLLRADYSFEQENHVFVARTGGMRTSITHERLEAIFTGLSRKQIQSQTTLVDSRSYEMLVREESRYAPSILYRSADSIHKKDNENGLEYTLGLPSDDYLLFLLKALAARDRRTLLRSTAMLSKLRRLSEYVVEGEDVFGLLKRVLPRCTTLKVDSTAKARNAGDLGKFANAFLFQLTYNMDVALAEVRYLDDFVHVRHIPRDRRSTVDEVDPPKRLYIPDVTYHYQMGVASESPVLSFLSFYHVAEHFFEDVFNDDMVESIRKTLTSPAFSYKRKRDILDLVKEVTRRQRVRAETVAFNEQDALRLVFERYVKFADLAAELNEYDPELVVYYGGSPVAFSGGDSVDLRAGDNRKLAELLSRRIYKTRNAIVHSKDGDKSKFVPFEHDKILIKEIPLLRFVAEQIIIESSKLVE